jgi:SAM-dependent methyltransferase
MCDIVNIDYLNNNYIRLENINSVLEVGSCNVCGNSKNFIINQGKKFVGIDIINGHDVDFLCDITDEIDKINTILNQKFELIIAMNVLEHIFDPVKAIKNMNNLLNDNGYIIIAVPLIWDLHAYPYDYYRLLPDFFRKIAEIENLTILENSILFSDRNTKKFFPDITRIPYAYEVYKGGRFNSLLKFIKRIINPIHLETYTHTYLNLIYQKKR